MTFFSWLAQRCCPHGHRRRERRDVGRVKGVLHLVCDDCGHAVPALDRSVREHLVALKAGRIRHGKAQRADRRVEPFTKRGPQ